MVCTDDGEGEGYILHNLPTENEEKESSPDH